MFKTTTTYVAAGGFNFYSTLSRRLNQIREEENLDITDDQIKNFLHYCASRILYSFGIHLGSKKKENRVGDPNKYINRIVREIQEPIIDKPYVPNNLKTYIDSGGFQVYMGYIPRDEIKKFTDTYAQFLMDHVDKYNYAFSLDIPPNKKVFKSWDDVYNFNKYSYEKLAELPKEVRDKIIYVYHFRSPKTYEIWYKLTFEEGLMDRIGSNHWSVGGIVAGLDSDGEIPMISYVLPLVPFIKYELDRNYKHFYFHILGGSASRDIFFYSIMKKHVKELYDIDIDFTYDSSNLFKQLLMGRYLDYIDESSGYLYKVNLMSDVLYTNINESMKKTHYDLVLEMLQILIDKFNLPQLDFSKGIYDESKENKPFFKSVELYLLFYLLYFHLELKQITTEFAEQIYPLYHQNRMKFNKEVFDFLHKLNRGVLSKKFRVKSSSILNSIDFLNDLNDDKVRMMIEKYMSMDEYSNLSSKKLTF